MKSQFKLIQFGAEANGYLKGFLSDSLTLGKEILKKINPELEKWHGYTILPERITLKEALLFELGGKIEGSDMYDTQHPFLNQNPVYDNLHMMLPCLEAFLSEDCRNLLVCENISAYPTDSNVRKDGDVVNFDNEVYFVYSERIISEDLIGKIIQKAGTYRFLGFGISLPKQERPPKNISIDFLETCAANTRIIIASAYDNEGYICWRRNT